MQRNSSKLSFWIFRPSHNKQPTHIQLPLIHKQTNDFLNGEFAHQIYSLTDQYNPKTKITIFNQILSSYGQTMDRYCFVIHPESIALLNWNILIFFAVFFSFIEIPIAILISQDSYYQLYKNTVLSVIYNIILSLLILDMLVVRPRISYEINGHYLNRNEDTMRYYLLNFFGFDLLGLVVIILSSQPIPYINYVRTLFFLKIVLLREINQQIKSRLLIKRYSSAVYQFLKLVFFIMFVTNLYSCIYFALDYYFYELKGDFYENGLLWINGSYSLGNLDILTTFGRYGGYIYALFWSLQTARTCGYGVATPKNYISIMYVNFVILSIVVIFVYFTNGVIRLILTHGEKRRRKENTIKKILQLEITQNTQNRLIQYISNFKNSQEEQLEQYMKMSLSQTLRNRFKLTFRSHFLSLIEMINLISDEDAQISSFKMDVVNMIQRKHYQHNELIFKPICNSKQTLILIEKGSCVIENMAIGYRKIMNQWGLIGKCEFYFEKKSGYTITAKQYLEGLELDRAEFISCLKGYKLLHEKYRQIIDGIVINMGSTKDLHIKCTFCNGYHLHQYCGLLNNWRNELRIKNMKEQMNAGHERVSFQRKSIKTVKQISFNRVSDDKFDSVFRSDVYFNHYNI